MAVDEAKIEIPKEIFSKRWKVIEDAGEAGRLRNEIVTLKQNGKSLDVLIDGKVATSVVLTDDVILQDGDFLKLFTKKGLWKLGLEGKY